METGTSFGSTTSIVQGGYDRHERLAPVVLLHGLLSSEREFGLIALPLRAAGVRLLTPRIEGYTDADRKRPRRWADWVAAAAQAVAQAVPSGEPFVLGGLCSGALIAAALAQNGCLPVQTLVLLSPTFDFDGWAQTRFRHWRRLGYALRLGNHISVRERPPYGIKNRKLRRWVERDLAQRAQSAAGPLRLPLWAIGETERLQQHVRAQLPSLATDTVLVHAREDEVCSLAAAERAFALLPPGPRNTLTVLDNSYHMITLDNDRAIVAAALMRAARNQAASTPVSGQPLRPTSALGQRA